jgi:uncharacterized protein with HEPN domain
MARARLVDRLDHIVEAVARIETLTAGKSFDDYTVDWMMRDAVERNFERLCEASRHIPDDLKARHAGIRWGLVADLGNVLRHAYDQVLDERIWNIVTNDLPPLKAALDAMLREAKKARPGPSLSL